MFFYDGVLNEKRHTNVLQKNRCGIFISIYLHTSIKA